MGSGKGSEPPTALAGTSQITFGLLAYSCIQVPQTTILPIHPPLMTRLRPLPHLSGILPDIQCLYFEKRGSEDPTSVIRRLKVGRCGMGRVWYPNEHPLHTPGDTLAEGVSDLLYSTT